MKIEMNMKRKQTTEAARTRRRRSSKKTTRMEVNSLPSNPTLSSLPHCHIKCSVQVECFWHNATNFRHTQRTIFQLIYSRNKTLSVISQWQKWKTFATIHFFYSLLCLILRTGLSIYRIVAHTQIHAYKHVEWEKNRWTEEKKK